MLICFNFHLREIFLTRVLLYLMFEGKTYLGERVLVIHHYGPVVEILAECVDSGLVVFGESRCKPLHAKRRKKLIRAQESNRLLLKHFLTIRLCRHTSIISVNSVVENFI